MIAAPLILALVAIANPVAQQLSGRVNRSSLGAELKQAVLSSIEAGKLPEAEQALVNESLRTPADPEVLALAAALFLADNQPLNAAIALKKVEKLRPLVSEEHFTLAMAYVAMKRGAWARDELDALTRQSPSEGRYLYWLARLNYDDGKYADAEKLLRRVVEADPASARAYDNLGLNLEALGRLDEALSAYSSAMAISRRQPDPSAWAALNFGTLALRLGNMKDAKVALDEAVQLEPRLAQAHYRLGVWYEKSGSNAAAIRELQTAAKLDPQYSEPWWALARLLRREGDTAGASAALAQFQKMKDKK